MMEMPSIIPRCFTVQQWREWRDAARLMRPNSRNGYCEDCTPTYQVRMVQLKRCEYPAVTFTFNPEEGICGHRPHVSIHELEKQHEKLQTRVSDTEE